MDSFDSTHYRGGIGRLLNLANCTRPDLMHSVSFLSRKCSNPTVSDWRNVEHLLRYLRGTSNLAIMYSKCDFFQSFVDADYANDDDRKSYSGFIIKLVGPISWRAKKQDRVSSATVEAEYKAQTLIFKELTWMRMLMTEISQDKFVEVPWIVYCDNNGAISLGKNKTMSDLSKHIHIKYHLIREAIKLGEVKFTYVKSENNLADIMTKTLPGPKTKQMLLELNMQII